MTTLTPDEAAFLRSLISKMDTQGARLVRLPCLDTDGETRPDVLAAVHRITNPATDGKLHKAGSVYPLVSFAKAAYHNGSLQKLWKMQVSREHGLSREKRTRAAEFLLNLAEALDSGAGTVTRAYATEDEAARAALIMTTVLDGLAAGTAWVHEAHRISRVYAQLWPECPDTRETS